MIGLDSSGDTAPVPLEEVAGLERLVPSDWVAASGDDVTREFIRYVAPLAGVIEALPVLEDVRKARAGESGRLSPGPFLF